MSRCAAQAVGTTVEDKALLRVKGNRAAAEIGFHGIAAIERGLHFVQIRVIDAVPQVDVFELERTFRLPSVTGAESVSSPSVNCTLCAVPATHASA